MFLVATLVGCIGDPVYRKKWPQMTVAPLILGYDATASSNRRPGYIKR